MKDSQGTHIINPETIKIIRNLRGKAVHEGLTREHYIERFREKYSLVKQNEGISWMALAEEYLQEWCMKNGIIGYDYIASLSLNVRRKPNE